MRVLIVDDNPSNRKLLRISLESEGHESVEAADGVEAIQKLEGQSVEGVISDILMPNMDGLALCLEVRRHPALQSLPFILYSSAYDVASAGELARAVGADNFIIRPAPIAEILGALIEARELVKSARTPSTLAPDPITVLKQYREGLVIKLEERNTALSRTLTELQAANQKFQRLNHELENRVRERTADLAAANEQLTRRNEEIRGFYHTLSHELKTPLTSAREFASLVLDGVAGPVTKTQKEYLKLSLESCDEIRRCLDDLLDAARLETGKMSLELNPGSLHALVTRVVKTLRLAASSHKVQLRARLASKLPSLPFDEYRIVQVLTNLINNAIKFTPPGGCVTVTLRACSTYPGFQEVSVVDTGCGIPGDQLPLIFERLYQVNHGDSVTNKGMGLGLYLCHELLHLHGGDITVESTVGRGSCFTFRLPEANHVLTHKASRLPTGRNSKRTPRKKEL